MKQPLIEYIKGDIAEITPATVVIDLYRDGVWHQYLIEYVFGHTESEQYENYIYYRSDPGRCIRPLRILRPNRNGNCKCNWYTDIGHTEATRHVWYCRPYPPSRAVRSNQLPVMTSCLKKHDNKQSALKIPTQHSGLKGHDRQFGAWKQDNSDHVCQSGDIRTSMTGCPKHTMLGSQQHLYQTVMQHT